MPELTARDLTPYSFATNDDNQLTLTLPFTKESPMSNQEETTRAPRGIQCNRVIKVLQGQVEPMTDREIHQRIEQRYAGEQHISLSRTTSTVSNLVARGQLVSHPKRFCPLAGMMSRTTKLPCGDKAPEPNVLDRVPPPTEWVEPSEEDAPDTVTLSRKNYQQLIAEHDALVMIAKHDKGLSGSYAAKVLHANNDKGGAL